MIFLPFVLPICVWVAYSDMKYMKIPNKAVLALAAVYLVVAPFTMPLAAFATHVGVGLGVLVIGFLMNMARLIGAGDAKFAAAMAPYFAFADLSAVLFLFAALLLVAFIGHRTARRVPAVRGMAPDWVSWTSPKFPMGIALASTLAVYLINSALAA